MDLAIGSIIQTKACKQCGAQPGARCSNYTKAGVRHEWDEAVHNVRRIDTKYELMAANYPTERKMARIQRRMGKLFKQQQAQKQSAS